MRQRRELQSRMVEMSAAPVLSGSYAADGEGKKTTEEIEADIAFEKRNNREVIWAGVVCWVIAALSYSMDDVGPFFATVFFMFGLIVFSMNSRAPRLLNFAGGLSWIIIYFGFIICLIVIAALFIFCVLSELWGAISPY